MSKSGLIDMHTHTCYSDGELTPDELVKKAEDSGKKISEIILETESITAIAGISPPVRT